MSFDTERLAAISEVRSYIGTPWMHQGRIKGVGVDCIGLTIIMARAAGAVPESEIAMLPSNYGLIPVQRNPLLRRTIEQHMVHVDRSEVLVGDILLGAWRNYPTHLLIVSNKVKNTLSAAPPFNVIHAQNDPWASRVVEEAFEWPAWRITSAYRFKIWL